jgi:antibiotic biosynthesis monooxygenase (ABM) superfamily enzyme
MVSSKPKEVTKVISRTIKPGHEKDYDDWLHNYLLSVSKAPGYLGTTIIIPGKSSSNVRYIIGRFTDKASMDTWDNSEESLKPLVNQLLYAALRDSNWLGDMVHSAGFENYSSTTKMENGNSYIHRCILY